AHAGPDDERNMFPETFAAIRQLKPKAVLIENVRGLARPAFKPFVEYIVDHLQLPGLKRKKGEDWPDHHQRLRKALKRRPKDPTDAGGPMANAARRARRFARARPPGRDAGSQLAHALAWREALPRPPRQRSRQAFEDDQGGGAWSRRWRAHRSSRFRRLSLPN